MPVTSIRGTPIQFLKLVLNYVFAAGKHRCDCLPRCWLWNALDENRETGSGPVGSTVLPTKCSKLVWAGEIRPGSEMIHIIREISAWAACRWNALSIRSVRWVTSLWHMDQIKCRLLYILCENILISLGNNTNLGKNIILQSEKR